MLNRLPSIARFLPTAMLILILAAAVGSSAIFAANPAADRLLRPDSEDGAPPALVSSEPANGATWRGGPVSLRFDRAMSGDSADYLSVSPALAGTALVDGTDVIFTASTTPDPGQRYTFTLAAKASAADGTRLNRPVLINVVAAMPLAVTSTQPSDGVADVSIDTSIMVVFNRPVVPLTGVEDQADLPQPLTISPAVDGAGEWINTSIYSFQPTLGLAGGADYSITVDGLAAVDGESLAEPYVYGFSTATPIVLEAGPMGEQVPPDTEVTVDFSQPMDQTSTEQAFSLLDGQSGESVDGAFSWSDDASRLTFAPADPLEFGARYEIVVAATALPASRQGTLREAYSSSFDVAPLPAVVSTTPENGQTGVPTDRTVTIRFNTPLSYTTVLPNISVSPVLTNTQVYSFYSEYAGEVTLRWTKEAYSSYSVTIGADIADLYGNTLGQASVIQFTTGDHSAFTRINLEQFTHFSAAETPVVNAYYRNMDDLTVDLYRLPMSELDRLTGRDQWQVWDDYTIPNPESNLIWSRPHRPDVGRNVVGEILIELNDAEREALPPGIYFLEMNAPPAINNGDDNADGSVAKEQKVIVLSDHNLVLKRSQQGNSLVWMTDLETGMPTSGAPIDLRANGASVGQSTTDEDGIAFSDVTLIGDDRYSAMLAVSGEPGDPDFAVVSTDRNEGVAPWDFDIPSGYGTPAYQNYFYTDRPIYRPGQTVFWKGIIRSMEDDAYRLPPVGTEVQIVVRDDRGNEIKKDTYAIGEYGTIHGEVTLAPEAFSGYYYLEASLPAEPDAEFYGGAGFQVASYRAPEFEINIAPEESEYLQGDTVRVIVEARYFSGGPLVDAAIDWRLITSPYTFSWQGKPDGRYFSFTPFDEDDFNFDPYRYSYYGGLAQEGVGVTDAQGRYVIEVPADLGDSLTSQTWRFDTTIQSSTNQFVNADATATVHKSDFYVGLSPRANVVRTGEESTIDVVTLEALGAPDNAPYPGADLAVTVYEFAWNSVYELAADGAYYWRNDVQRTPILTSTVTTGRDGMAEITWTPEQGGQYQIEARGSDEAGNEVSSVTYVWVGGGSADEGEFVSWRRENNDRIELVADKDLYAPGDVARVLVPSPFSGPVDALVTIERNGVLDAQIVTLESNSELIDIPITAEHIPNVFVSVVLAKGIDETNPTPAVRIGYVELPVDVGQKELTIDIEPSAQQVRPGETVSYDLLVRDYVGEPVANAEVSVALVDKAVLSLSDNQERPLIDIFYYRRGLGVQTGALLIINNDRLSQQLTEGAKGGGGGGGGLIEVREDFADLAYWRADLISDIDGRITFNVPLPDNLTTWQMAARAVTAETEVGDAVNEVVATKDLQLRPLLPRFLTGGDRARVGVVLINASDQRIEEGVLTVDIAGVDVESGDLARPFALGPGEQVQFDWTIAAPSDGAIGEMNFGVEARSSNPDEATLADAIYLSLPINRYETPEIVGTSGTVPPEGRIETVIVPPDATDSGELVVGLEASLAAGMTDALGYLEHYPYECNEQTVSRFLPNLLTMRSLRMLDLDDPDLADQVAFQLGVGVQRLVSRQNPDGGWGYWSGEDSSPFITTYALWGLATAGELGYTVPESSIEAAVAYIDRSFRAPSEVTNDWQLNEMAFSHFVLSELGEGDPGRASTLYETRERLALYGQAYLAMALDNMREGEEDPRIDTLLDNLFGALQISATGASWHEATVDNWTLNTDLRTTAVVLAAFVRLDPEQPILPQVVRWLMSARQAGRWATTQENAWSIIALTDWLMASGELEAEYDWSVTLNEGELGRGSFNEDNLKEQVELRTAVADLLRDEANVVRFERSNESGQLYYTTQLRYALDALAVDALDRGVVVDRRFELENEPVSVAYVGDVISATVTLIVPDDRYHLLVEVPIPAGTEPVDTSLATESDLYGAPELTPVDEPFTRWTPTYTDIRDDKVALFATYLPAGTYQYTVQIRATVPGEYRVLPVYAEQMYFPDVWGRSAGQLFTVKE